MMTYKQTRSLTAALLAVALVACGDAEDGTTDESQDDGSAMRDEDDDQEGQDDDMADDQADDEGDDAPRDAGASGGKDAAPSTGSSKDAGVLDAGPSSADGGRGPRGGRDDAATSRADAAPQVPSGDAGGGAVASGNDVPAGEHCAPVAAWDAQSAMFEQQVLELTNAARAAGHNCDTEGNFGPAGPLKMEARLRCSSRLHSKYMADNGEFAHTQSKTGQDPFARMMAAGYRFTAAGENIAAGQTTPQQVVNGWLDSDGHCANIMNPQFTELGVGYVVGASMSSRPGGRGMPYWTQNFGRPR